MALAARKERYEQFGSYGREGRRETRKTARPEHGFNWEVRRRDLEQAGESREEQAQKRKTAAQRRLAAREKRRAALARLRLPVVGVVGTALAAVLAVMVLMGHIELTRLSSETVSLKKQLSTLQAENTSLTARYERTFDLASVKEAARAAGMAKPSASQISYLNISEGDRAVVYPREESGVFSHILLSARGGFEALKEFFD